MLTGLVIIDFQMLNSITSLSNKKILVTQKVFTYYFESLPGALKQFYQRLKIFFNEDGPAGLEDGQF